MVDTHAIAVSPEKTHFVVKRGNNYAVVDRKEGITKSTEWGTKNVLHSMKVKGNFLSFKKPIKYKGPSIEKSRKSTKRIDRKPKAKAKKRTERQQLLIDLGLENVASDLNKPYIKSNTNLILDIAKAGKAHLPEGSDRYSYTTPSDYGIIHIPVNRLNQVYQTDEAINPKKVKENRKKMRANKPLDPVEIGYNYDVHDGHHRWHAAMGEGYTHVPCKVVGKDPNKVKEAKEKYRAVWKGMSKKEMSQLLSTDMTIEEFQDMLNKEEDKESTGVLKSDNLALVINLSKSTLNTSKLVRKRVMVRGKGGQIFYRMQWVDPNDKHSNIVDHKKGEEKHHTYAHHEEGLKEMEKRQSTRFPVRHHKADQLNIKEHNYRVDRKKLHQAEQDFKSGKKLPPIKINHDGDVLDNHHLLELAKRHGLSHVPVTVMGNPMLKKQLEDKLKEKVIMEDVKTGEQATISGEKNDDTSSMSSDMVQSISEFKNFTKKKYPKKYLMDQAKKQGITWDDRTKAGSKLPENSSILWLRAHQAIVNHIKEGNHFSVDHDEKQVDRKMEQSGKDTIHKHFLKLLEKHGSKDALMEWAREKDIHWKEKKDPLINWMYATTAIKKELAKGKMLDGIRTRQKGAMEEANLEVTDQVKQMVRDYAKLHGKGKVMATADELGITYDKYDKKGNELTKNSKILWMRAHQAISRHIAKGNEFRIGEESGNTATVGEYGGVDLTDTQGLAVDLGKRNNHHLEAKSKDWATKALMIDRGISQDEANQLYEKFRENSRNSKLMVHFDPFEILPNGTMLMEQLSSDNSFKNDFQLGRGIDTDEREVNERDMFGDEYDEATDEERPNYGALDLLNQGLGSNAMNGEVAFVLKDDVKKRSTGSHMDSGSIPYGEETKWTRSLEDPHHMLVDRWRSKWKQPKKQDKQRMRMMDSVINGEKSSDSDLFESHIHGGIDFGRDVDHVLVPQSWKTDKQHKDKHEAMKSFSELMGINMKYEG